MNPSGDAAAPRVELVPVVEDVLRALVAIAIADADPDDVTPPLEDGWGPARITSLRDFHRRCRPGAKGGNQLTTAGNLPALAALRRAGAVIETGQGSAVSAVIELGQ
ncbi:hypothetical protein [Kocuria rosea]|uniref:hypothetical protein n=1 Tax=Kocuria rosea TaxID=1275 RepID=UPI000F71309D|nr:hypothetical protein [Kocuria rosea]VEI50371.1 Uncharacterised protein [Kocuria rosea]